MFEGGIITLQKRAYMKYEGFWNSLFTNQLTDPFQGEVVAPRGKIRRACARASRPNPYHISSDVSCWRLSHKLSYFCSGDKRIDSGAETIPNAKESLLWFF